MAGTVRENTGIAIDLGFENYIPLKRLYNTMFKIFMDPDFLIGILNIFPIFKIAWLFWEILELPVSGEGQKTFIYLFSFLKFHMW